MIKLDSILFCLIGAVRLKTLLWRNVFWVFFTSKIAMFLCVMQRGKKNGELEHNQAVIDCSFNLLKDRIGPFQFFAKTNRL